MATKETNQKQLRKAFMTTIYDTLDGIISPTPYLEIIDGDAIDVQFLNGKGRLPKPNSTEVTALDLTAAALFFDDFHLLWEGVTGVGKTYTSDALSDAIFGPDGHYTVRLSGGVLGSSALEPFTTTVLENGVPRTRIDPRKCARYGGLFIDEINRGDAQEVLQVVDGVIHVGNETGYLQFPIPGTDRHKKIKIVAAMNPADAQHSAAVDLDIAGENRFLKFRYPNGVAEAASSQLAKRSTGSLYDRFWSQFHQKTGRSEGWRENYPLVTDPDQFAHTLDGKTREFIDTALGYVGYDPKETCERNRELMADAGIQLASSIRDDNDYRKIVAAQGKLKHGFVRRDLRKISDLARLLAFVKGVKHGTHEANVGLNDVAASIGVILESKTITGTDYGGLMTLVNDARAAYAEMHRQMNVPEGYGAGQALWQAAVYAGSDHGFDAYLNTLRSGMTNLNTQVTTPAQVTLRSRVLADLVVLEHFSKTHEADVKAALGEKGERAFAAFGDVYNAKKGQSSIYEHRLGSIMG